MPAQKRHKTNYPGVYFINGTAIGTGKPEKIYYITYRKDGKQIHEKAGRHSQDDMTPARAATKRGDKISGKEPSNKEKREMERARKEAEAGKWTIDRLWEEYKSQRNDSRNLQIDEGRYKRYLKDKFKNKEPHEIIQLDIDRLRMKLLKKISPQSVKHILSLLKRIDNFGVKKGLCDGMPFKIEMPVVNNLTTEDLTPEQLERLLIAIEQDTHLHAKNMMKLAMYTGLRRGELFKLKWKHIDFERGFIKIVDPKGGPDQTIPLNDPARDLLNSHPKEGSPYVFPGQGGRQRATIHKPVNRIKKRAGLPEDFRPLHGLRHFFASTAASSGEVDMYHLQKLLTHKSPVMTQRYAHLRDGSLKKASMTTVSKIEQAAEAMDKDKVINLDDHKK